MSEPSKERTGEVTDIFIKRFNQDFNKSFVFNHQDQAYRDYDFLFKDDSEFLMVQYIEAVPTRGEELSSLKNFENDKVQQNTALHLQTDELRIEESLGRKLNHHYSTEDQLVILIDFGLFSWNLDSLPKMQDVTRRFKGKFKNVYCVHLGKQMCEKLI